MKKDANIFLTEEETISFVKMILEMKPGTYIGERDGAKFYFRGTECGLHGLMISAVYVEKGEEEYKGQPIYRNGVASMTTAAAATLLGLGHEVNAEEVK